MLIYHRKLDILCFSETFFMNSNVNIMQIDGFKLADHFSRKDKSRVGVCIYVKKGINYKNLPYISELSVALHFECCGIFIPDLNYFVICCYRPPHGNFDLFIEKLNSLLNKLTFTKNNLKKKIIFLGDFNIDILKDNMRTTTFVNILRNFKLTLTIHEPTRITPNSKTCIDNIVTNIKTYKTEILNLGISDHTGQLIKIPCSMSFSQQFWYVYKKTVTTNIEIFIRYISQISFSSVYDHSDVNMAYAAFIELFKLLYDLCIPYKKIKITHKRQPNWKTKGIIISSINKRKLHLHLHKYYIKKK